MLFTVTSPGELTQRSYVLTVYVMLEDQPGASVASVDASAGDLEPGFEPALFKYSLIVPAATDQLRVAAVSYAATPLALCAVQAPSKALREAWVAPAGRTLSPDGQCQMMESGGDGRSLRLRPGFNLLELKAVPPSGGEATFVYQVLVFRRLAPAGGPLPPAPPGSLPGATLIRGARGVVTVESFDRRSNTIVVSDDKGVQQSFVLKTQKMRDFARRLRRGDKVDVAIMEAVSIDVVR